MGRGEPSTLMMEHLQSFFEEMDEFVYISDLETHQLVYMNRRLRESLNCGPAEDYTKKRCYEVLQGTDRPCAFCNDNQLKAGQFLSWIHKNPVFNKRYLIKDSLLEDNGRKYRIEIAVDVDAEVLCKTPYYYARSETILNECMRQMFSTTNPNDALELLLAYLGRTFECDRTYVFEIDADERVDNTYEWCAPGVEPQKDILQKVPLSSIDWWMQVFSRNEVILIRNLEDIRLQYPLVYALLKPQNVDTLAAGPVCIEGKVVGFLGVDNPSREMMGILVPIVNVLGRFVASHSQPAGSAPAAAYPELPGSAHRALQSQRHVCAKHTLQRTEAAGRRLLRHHRPQTDQRLGGSRCGRPSDSPLCPPFAGSPAYALHLSLRRRRIRGRVPGYAPGDF